VYGKIFESIYDGTLVEDWRALVTFQQMIVLCDADGIIDMTPSAISRRTGIPIEHIKAGIEILENEDPYSRTEGEGGRRIVRLEDHRPWGWYLVNHQKYKHLQDSDTVRAQNRERKRRQRAKEKESRSVTDGHAPSRHTDTDTDTDTNTSPSGRARKRAPADFTVTVEMYEWAEATLGLQASTVQFETEKFMDHEFKNAKKDWPATWRNWMRAAKDMPSVQSSRKTRFEELFPEESDAA